ncbi:MAG: ATP-binding protein [Lachnospiraceae bacterium]|nr:ATP-binding protein [Lachnospiraceae bacterium]
MLRDKELLLYRGFNHGDILDDASELIYEYEFGYDEEENERYRALLFSIAHRLIELAYSHGYTGNLWQMYLTYLLVNNENAYSMAVELKGHTEGTLNDAALHDLRIFKDMFEYDLAGIDENLNAGCLSILTEYNSMNEQSKMFNKRVRDRVCELSVALAAAEDVQEFKDILESFYKDFGVGKFGLHKAFRVEHDAQDNVVIKPITNIAHVYLEDLVGYEIAKQKLIENTEAFVEGRPANNCLLFGDAGTGKSSAIKGIMNKYYDKGLRLIELYKHQFKDINDIIAQVKNRNYRFIIYMDDLSFEDFETDYKYLKAVIEGGLEKKPDNVLIYATSNRRHLIKETWSDRDDIKVDNGIHKSDTMQEKLSLVYRFGVTIYFGKPDKKEFNNIVKVLAERNNIDMPEDELLLEAGRWELAHGGLSGRTAVQYVDHILGTAHKL